MRAKEGVGPSEGDVTGERLLECHVMGVRGEELAFARAFRVGSTPMDLEDFNGAIGLPVPSTLSA